MVLTQIELCRKGGTFFHTAATTARSGALHRLSHVHPVGQCGVIGQIHLQRGEGDMAGERGVEIGAIHIVLGGASAANLVHGLAARILLCDDAFGRMSSTQSAYLE